MAEEVTTLHAHPAPRPPEPSPAAGDGRGTMRSPDVRAIPGRMRYPDVRAIPRRTRCPDVRDAHSNVSARKYSCDMAPGRPVALAAPRPPARPRGRNANSVRVVRLLSCRAHGMEVSNAQEEDVGRVGGRVGSVVIAEETR